jgi:signal transduction histidine kinase/ligand-binding sensor domain-containing protein
MAVRIRKPGLAFICLSALFGGSALAEHLPVKLYTIADGLPSNSISRIYRDSHGFVWFCTAEGLARFDGYTFTTFGTGEGLPEHMVTDFLQTRDGEYWVATPHTFSHFRVRRSSADNSQAPAGPGHSFEPYQLPQLGPKAQLVGLTETPDGGIWCLVATMGLIRLDRRGGRFEEVPVDRGRQWTSLAQDPGGALWLAGEGGLVRRFPDGRLEEYGEREGLPADPHSHMLHVSGVWRDRRGVLWAATWRGLCRMRSTMGPGRPSVETVYTRRDGLPGDVVFDVFEAREGTLWAGAEGGLAEFVPGEGQRPDRFRAYTARHGLDIPGVDGPAISAFAEDDGGNLWMCGGGALRLTPGSFITYTREDGLSANSIGAIFEDRSGHLIAASGDPQFRFLNAFDGERFSRILPRVPNQVRRFTWGHGQIHFEDHLGAWWIPTSDAILHYPPGLAVEDLAASLPDRVFTTRDGLPSNTIFRLFEDSRGDVWVSTVGPDVVTLWSRAEGVFRNFSRDRDGNPLGTPTAFAEDRAGNIWMGLFWGHAARYSHGRFQIFTAADGLPEGVVNSLYVDHAGRLWLGSTRGGLARVDRPDQDMPRFKIYNAASGLSANDINCITEDSVGRIYAGTGRGLDRLDPETGRVRRFSEEDGLRFADSLTVAYRDRRGNLWFGGTGLWRLAPQPERASVPPNIRISGVSVLGKPRLISDLGETSVAGLRLRSGENQITIDYGSLNFGVGEAIRYQYRLEGSEWAGPVDSRSVNYAGLAPGNYRFLVRAVNWEGVGSTPPASVDFVILPPIWQRWWFVSLAAAGICLAAFAVHRVTLRQALELERVRTRIATDLHDDIGSSLTQIAVLSEVARKSINGSAAGASAPLSRIADLSRELVDSMSDIVWSINPERDRLSDLAYRMRRFAGDVFAARDIDFDFTAPAPGNDIALPAEVRRQIFLISKECVHNALRHAACTRVEMLFRAQRGQVVLRIADNGRGFAWPENGPGQGLASIGRRAREIGARLQVFSEPGRGTVMTLHVPLKRRVHLNR